MITIKPNQDFKDDRKTYRKGRKYEVSEEDAEYFAACGWVGEQPKGSTAHNLDVHDVAIGHSSEVN